LCREFFRAISGFEFQEVRIMSFKEEAVQGNRDYFAAKLSAEKQKADVVKKVKEKSGDFVILDTRAREAFEQGHIPGAWCVPLAEISALASNLPKDREMVTYCWNHT
jgi:3-mercaptopyruvate sulfurtransferase SseA